MVNKNEALKGIEKTAGPREPAAAVIL